VAVSQRRLLEQGKAGWGLGFTRAVHKRENPWCWLVFFSRTWTHSIHLVLSPLLQLASMNSFWILKCTSKVGSPLMRVWWNISEPDTHVYGALNKYCIKVGIQALLK
jgi:hypothetical protein